jgi:hypothetical protein
MTNLQKCFFQKSPTLSPCKVGIFWENRKNLQNCLSTHLKEPPCQLSSRSEDPCQRLVILKKKVPEIYNIPSSSESLYMISGNNLHFLIVAPWWELSSLFDGGINHTHRQPCSEIFLAPSSRRRVTHGEKEAKSWRCVKLNSHFALSAAGPVGEWADEHGENWKMLMLERRGVREAEWKRFCQANNDLSVAPFHGCLNWICGLAPRSSSCSARALLF